MNDRLKLSPDSKIDTKEVYKQLQAVAAKRTRAKYEPKNGGSSLAEFFKAMDNLADNYRPNKVLPLARNSKAASE